MIRSFQHKGLQNYWTKGVKKGLNPSWISKIRRLLGALDAATRPEDMNYPGSGFHQLSGKNNGRYSVKVTGNYRITFAWSAPDAVDVDLEDYH